MITYGKMNFSSIIGYGTTLNSNFFVEKIYYETDYPIWIPEGTNEGKRICLIVSKEQINEF